MKSIPAAVLLGLLAAAAATLQAELALYPSELECPENVGVELKLRIGGAPSGASVTYSSSDESVAKVSADGVVQPVKPGSCEISASAGAEKSNAVKVRITPKVVRAANRKLALQGTKKPRFTLQEALAWPQAYGQGKVALWRNGATGALSVTADDNLFWNFPRWDEYRRRYGIPVTLFVATKQKDKSAGIWQDMLAKGHSVQSHTKTHPSKNAYRNEMSSAEIWMDFLQAHRELDACLTNRSLTVAYSWGVNYPEMTSQIYIAGRGTTGLPNRPGRIDWNNVNSYSLGCQDELTSQIASTWDPEYKIWNKSAVGAWTVLLYHNIAKDADGSGLDRGLALAKRAVDEGKLWADTFENVARYGQEHDTAKLEIAKVSPDAIEFKLTDEMDDEIFDYPLTVILRADASWRGAKAVQNGIVRAAKLAQRDGATYVLVDAVPDRGAVRVERLRQ